MKRITWVKEKLKSGITAFNDKKEELGWLQYKRVGSWMHWCWYQNQDIRMLPGCLQEVRDKQKELKSIETKKLSKEIVNAAQEEGRKDGSYVCTQSNKGAKK